jgi:hypothetical protein
MSRPSASKQQQWKQEFQQKAAYAFANDRRSNVKAFIAGPYVVIKVFGKSVPLPGVSSSASSMHVTASHQETSCESETEESLCSSPKERSSSVGTQASSTIPRTPEENRRRNVKRKQADLQLLIHQNFSPCTAVFATVTFQQRQLDISVVIRECQKLFKRLRRHVPNVRYIAVPERHMNGGWHVHLLLDRELPLTKVVAQPYLDSGSIQSASGSWEKLWKLGIVHQKRLDQGGNLGASIATYVTKNATDEELAGHHTVWKSDNLEPPTEIIGQDAVELLQSFAFDDLAPSYGYHCENCGFVETMDVFEFCLNPTAAMLNKAWWRINSAAA